MSHLKWDLIGAHIFCCAIVVRPECPSRVQFKDIRLMYFDS